MSTQAFSSENLKKKYCPFLVELLSGWITLESSLFVVKYQRWEVLKFWHTCPIYFNFLQNKTKYLNSSSWNYKNCFTIYELIILTTFTYFWMLRLVNCSSASKFKLSIDLSFEWRQIFYCYKFIGLFHKKKNYFIKLDSIASCKLKF